MDYLYTLERTGGGSFFGGAVERQERERENEREREGEMKLCESREAFPLTLPSKLLDLEKCTFITILRRRTIIRKIDT